VVDQGLQLVKASTTANEHSFYLQDYWQVTPRINLTYGMRYEYQQPYVEANNNESNFDISTLLIQLAGWGNNPRSLVNSNTIDFMPRAGIDFQLNPRQLLQAGLAPLESFHEWYWRERDVTSIGLIGVGSYSGDAQHARYETYDREVDLDELKMTPHPARAAGPDNGACYGDIAIPANTAYLLLSEQSLERMAVLLGDHCDGQSTPGSLC
jgi:TonB dependent receptor